MARSVPPPDAPPPQSIHPVTRADIGGIIAVSVVVAMVCGMGISAWVWRDSSPAVVAHEEEAVSEEVGHDYVLGFADRPPASTAQSEGHLLNIADAVFADVDHRLVGQVELAPDAYHDEVADMRRSEAVDLATTDGGYESELCVGSGGYASPSVPVARLLDAFLVPEGNPDGLHSLDDVVDGDLTLGVPDGGPYRERAEEAGVASDSLVEIVTEPEDVAEVTAALVEDGRVDAFLYDSQTLRWSVDDRDLAVDVTEPFAPVADSEEVHSYRGFYVGNPDLARDIDAVLIQMRSDGRLLELGRAWGMTDEHLPPSGLSGLDVCAS